MRLQRAPAAAPLAIAACRQLEEERAAVVRVRAAVARARGVSSRRTTSDAVVSGRPARRRAPSGASPARAPIRLSDGVAVRLDAVGGELALDELRHPLMRCHEQQQRARALAAQTARRICSSSGTSGSVEGVGGIVVRRRRCRPPAIIATWSVVSGAPGSPLREARARCARRRTGRARGGRRLPSTFAIVRYSSFHVTTSGPPSSNVWFAAAGRSTACAKYAATSSTQIGWIRCVPGADHA